MVKLQNTRPTICISLNKNSAYCYLRSRYFADSRYFAHTEALNNYALIMQQKSLFR